MSEGKMSDGKMSEEKMSEEKLFEGKMSVGKVSERKVSEGKISEGKMSEGKVSDSKVTYGCVNQRRISKQCLPMIIRKGHLIQFAQDFFTIWPLSRISAPTCCHQGSKVVRYIRRHCRLMPFFDGAANFLQR